MSRFARGIKHKKSEKVIGYVGATGLATGPPSLFSDAQERPADQPHQAQKAAGGAGSAKYLAAFKVLIRPLIARLQTDRTKLAKAESPAGQSGAAWVKTIDNRRGLPVCRRGLGSSALSGGVMPGKRPTIETVSCLAGSSFGGRLLFFLVQNPMSFRGSPADGRSLIFNDFGLFKN